MMPYDKCFLCGHTLEELNEGHKELIEKYGWYAHLVINDDSYPYGVNVHSHHVSQSFGHPDFQVCFPIPGEMAHGFIADLIDRVRKGETFEEGQKVGNIISNYDITFIRKEETGREVLRLIFPDTEGNLDEDIIDEQFRTQFKG